jgi:UbiD family decarboxylase
VRATDLRVFLTQLETAGELARVPVEVDSDQDITIIQHRLLATGGPAVLFEKIKGSPYRLVSNLYGTAKRVEMAFGRPPAEIGRDLVRLAERLMPPSLSAAWGERKVLWRLAQARLREVGSGPVMDTCLTPPRLDQLPVLKCWPLDGGAFFTLPLVHTTDPRTGVGNLGIYRLQRFDDATTGMHWQIEKGGGFHFKTACELGRPLPVSVMLGGPPALTLAAIAPLPEGIDERLLAALIMGKPLDVILREQTGHRIAANAEFVLEGSVTAGDMRQEGPFGDHLGHYSHSAPFPVFRVDRMLARRDAIYPATVVGKPPQEDYFIGEALQEMVLPLIKLLRPAISNLWAYPETGFHPLSVIGVKERYAREGLKHALGMLGEGQMSLTKIMMVVDHDVDVRDFRQVSRAIWQNLDAAEGLHLLAPTAQDTLDFTGPAMNTGSKLVLLATRGERPPRRTPPPPPPPRPTEVHRQILGLVALGEAFLVAQVGANAEKSAIREALSRHPVTREYIFHVLVSEDVPLDDIRLLLWGWFTRFDPLVDLHPAALHPAGNRMLMSFPIAIDATWKPGYRLPVAFDPEHERRVAAAWTTYGLGGE